jgi:restriction system protein
VEAGYARHRASLASDLLAKLRECSPPFFEQVVVDLLVAMGYGGSRLDAGEAVGRAGDGGIDGIIKEDRLGLEGIYVQAKRWDSSVGRPIVQAFAGSLEGHRARKGVLITTSDFTADARDYVTRIEKRIVLISGTALADLMVEHGVGVTDVTSYTLKRLDGDYFGEGE